jgi:RNA polymerase sigma-70 factor (ECF subfamily)
MSTLKLEVAGGPSSDTQPDQIASINYPVRNDLFADEDKALVARAKARDRDALNKLLERHLTTVHKFVSVKIGPEHPDVDDVVQETLIGATGTIGGLRGESNAQVAGWLIAIARRKIADHLRAHYRHPHESLDASLGDAVPAPGPPVDDVVVQMDRAERVRRMLSELTPEQEEVLILRFILGFGINEVAEMTQRPAGAVKSMQHRALAALIKKLNPEDAP